MLFFNFDALYLSRLRRIREIAYGYVRITKISIMFESHDTFETLELDRVTRIGSQLASTRTVIFQMTARR